MRNQDKKESTPEMSEPPKEPKVAAFTSEWLTTEETMQVLNMARRTLQKWAQQGRLRWRMQRLPGRKPERVYDVRDVEKLKPLRGMAPLKAERALPGEKRAPVVRSTSGGSELLVVKEISTMMREVMEKLLTEHQTQHELERARLELERSAQAARQEAEQRRWEIERQEAELRRKDWLTPRECFRGWGMPARTAIALAQQGQLTAVPYGKGWRIQRKSLEAFGGRAADYRTLKANGAPLLFGEEEFGEN